MSTIKSHAKPAAEPNSLNAANIRRDFPIFSQPVHGKELVYLDSGATTQKPHQVIEATTHFYETQNANIHRGNYYLSLEATAAYEKARTTVARFINAREPAECLFTRSTTESINLVAASLGRLLLKPGDEVVVSTMEHHSNIVPWQMACEYFGAHLQVIGVNDAGELRLDEYEKILGPRTKIVAITHLSNVLGTINDIPTIVKLAHAVGAAVLVDGAQWVGHHPTDIQALDADFYAFSGHKLYGPTGIGVLYGKRSWAERMPPYQGGGDMIEHVTFQKTTYAGIPNKFEAGTPNIAGAVGLGAAIEYLSALGFDKIAQHEEALLHYAERRLAEVAGLRMLGNAKNKSGIISFVLENPAVNALDVGTRLDLDGIAVRTGHHCCEPLMGRLGVDRTVRMSLGIYNTAADIDALVESLLMLRKERGRQGDTASHATTAVPSGNGSIPLAVDEVVYPPASADSPNAAADELIDEFSFLDDWNDRYEYIIDLGKKLPPFPEGERTDYNRVRGCQSTVFLSARKRPGTADTLDFLAHSDADIVNGLIAILQRLFSGQKASQVLAFNIGAFLKKIGLDEKLALSRRNGLASMIARIQSLAGAIEKSCVPCAKC
jgi:cysteine desulfurase/selenocysteine lyase